MKECEECSDGTVRFNMYPTSLSVWTHKGQKWCRQTGENATKLDQLTLRTSDGTTLVLCDEWQAMDSGDVKYVPVGVKDLPACSG